MRIFYTYLHCKPDGTPFYVGKGVGKRNHDFKMNRNKHYKNIIAKYGAENIQVFVFPCDSEKQALDDEVQQIAQLRQENYRLANICDGGEGAIGYKFTDEVRAKISAAIMGNKYAAGNKIWLGRKHTSATKIKISAAKKGSKPTTLGKTWKLSDDECAKHSSRMIGNTHGSALKGIPWSAKRRAAENAKRT